MTESWEDKLSCATQCDRCHQKLGQKDQRIFSVYDHQPICMICKKAEEERSDYEAVSKAAIGQCLIDTELAYGDPGGYCFHHFYPFTC
ncbi:MAG: hypothetical protein HY895_10730 [Deltaproteobacteria bacterium]|nr:hypothetical protein [Deltaproteobacteria bacterium]